MLQTRRIIALMAVVLIQACGNPLGDESTIDSSFSPGGDATAPSTPGSLSLSGDPSFSVSPTLTWTASTDNESITGYKVGLGTTAGSDNVVSFLDVGNVTSYQFTAINPQLVVTTTYYFSLKAVDSSGNESAVASSTGWSPGLALESNAYKLPESPDYYDSCADYLASSYYNGEGDGNYWVDLDGPGGNPAFISSCDMTTDNGGWTLVLNYVHQGGTTPATAAKLFSLPYISSSTLGDDESGQAANWGHASASVLNAISFTEAKFYCQTSAHARIVNFKTGLAGAITYIGTGTGTMSGVEGSNNKFLDHTGNLPDNADSFQTNQGDATLTNYPFSGGGANRWAVGELNRWECDDAPANAASDTIHRVWVR